MKFENILQPIKKYQFDIIFVALIFIIDQLTKIWAVKYLQVLGTIKVFPFFHLTYVQNTGAAFGSFQGQNYVLAGVSCVVLFFLFKWRKDIFSLGKLGKFAFVLILAGALGNMYDRIILGYVVDMFDFLVWPVFNVADSAICVGATLFVLGLIIDNYKKRSVKK